MINDLFAKFDGAFAPNTIRAYRSDYEHYLAWCKEHNKTAIPPEAETLADYVENMAQSMKSATIRRRIQSLGTVFRLSRIPDTTHDPDVILALKRIHRRIGRIQSQAHPLTRDVMDKLLKVCAKDVSGLRDQVMLKLGYETMRRRSELCSMRFEDVTAYPNGQPCIHLRFSKTDQFGAGTMIPIGNDLVALIERWKVTIGASSGYILRAVNKRGHVGESLHPASITRLLRDLQDRAFGIRRDMPGLSGHSFRVGAALDMVNQGETLARIMLRGGWKTESTAIRYLRNYAFDNGFDRNG
jgi:site-specific recombinase XerD